MNHWVGWIKARPEDLSALRDLGVSGMMVYNPQFGVFEHCAIDEEVAERLEKEWLGFWMGSFSPSKGVTGEPKKKPHLSLRGNRVVGQLLRELHSVWRWIEDRGKRDRN